MARFDAKIEALREQMNTRRPTKNKPSHELSTFKAERSTRKPRPWSR